LSGCHILNKKKETGRVTESGKVRIKQERSRVQHCREMEKTGGSRGEKGGGEKKRLTKKARKEQPHTLNQGKRRGKGISTGSFPGGQRKRGLIRLGPLTGG